MNVKTNLKFDVIIENQEKEKHAGFNTIPDEALSGGNHIKSKAGSEECD